MNFFTRAVLGTDFYHIIQWFLVYGILGWIVESVYMSICNRKLTNRGFTHGPICPIYGFGALWGTDSLFPAASVCRKSGSALYYGLHCANFT